MKRARLPAEPRLKHLPMTDAPRLREEEEELKRREREEGGRGMYVADEDDA